MALTSTGQVLTWGWSLYLGDGSTVDRSTPAVIALPGHRRAMDISASNSGGAVVTRDGGVYGWGDNDWGQLGNGHSNPNGTVARPVAAVLPAGFRATAVAIGPNHQLVLGSVNGVGEVVGFGDNRAGELGTGTSSASPQLSAVVTRFPSSAGSIASIYASSGGSAALTSAGVFYRWGDGQLGANGIGKDVDVLAPGAPSLPAGTLVTAVAMRDSNTEVVTSRNTVYGWGDNEAHALGAGPTGEEDSPIQIPMPAGAIAGISADDLTSFVFLGNG